MWGLRCPGVSEGDRDGEGFTGKVGCLRGLKNDSDEFVYDGFRCRHDDLLCDMLCSMQLYADVV